MSFAVVVDRVRTELTELPGLELTMPQAIRLWSLGADDCRIVIDALVDAGFLAWTPKRTIVRAGREKAAGQAFDLDPRSPIPDPRSPIPDPYRDSRD